MATKAVLDFTTYITPYLGSSIRNLLVRTSSSSDWKRLYVSFSFMDGDTLYRGELGDGKLLYMEKTLRLESGAYLTKKLNVANLPPTEVGSRIQQVISDLDTL